MTIKSYLERLSFTLYWAWSWKRFWKGWKMESSFTISILIGALVQVLKAIVYPVWRLFIDPFLAANQITDEALKMLKNSREWQKEHQK